MSTGILQCYIRFFGLDVGLEWRMCESILCANRVGYAHPKKSSTGAGFIHKLEAKVRQKIPTLSKFKFNRPTFQSDPHQVFDSAC